MTARTEKFCIFSTGFLFRIFLVVYIVSANPYGLEFFNNPSYQGSDQDDFVLIVKNIVEHGVFSFSKEAPFVPDQFRTPAFPLFMALSYWLTNGFLLFTFLNILISSAIGIIVYEISRQLFLDRRLAFWSGLIFNLLPYGAYLSTMAMADNLFTSLFVLSVFFIIKFLKEQIKNYHCEDSLIGEDEAILKRDCFASLAMTKNLIFGGIFLALATLTRPITQYFVILVIIFLIFLKSDFKKKIIWASIFFLSFLLISSPWLIRNYLVFKKPMLSSLAGYHMFVSWVGPFRAYIKDHIPRSEEANKLYQYIQDKYGKYGAEAMYDPVVSAKLGEEAKKEILQNFSTYTPFHLLSGAIFYMNNDVILTLSEVFKIRSGNIYIIEKITGRDWAGFWKNLGQLNYLYLFIYFFSYLLIFAKNIFALIGLKNYFKISPVLTLFILSLLIYFPVLVGPEGHARFRYPIEPFLVIFAMFELKSLKLYEL